MDGAYRHPCLGLPTKCLSGNSAIDVVSDRSPNTGQFLPQGPLLEDVGQQVNRWLPGIPLHALDSPVTEGSYPAGLHPSIQSTPIRGNDVICPSDPMYWASVFPWFAESGYSPRAPYVGPASVNTTDGQYQDEMTTNIRSVQGYYYQYARPDTTTNISVASPLPDFPRTPGIGQYKGQGAPEASHQESQKTGKRGAVVAPRSSQRPTGIRGARKGPHSCDVCGKSYSQPQGIKRHQRETHYVSFCAFCRDFRWGRRYKLRKHLEKKHPNVDVDAALNEATSTRRGKAETGHGRD